MPRAERLAGCPPVVQRMLGRLTMWRDVDWNRGTSNDATGSFVRDNRRETAIDDAEAASSRIQRHWTGEERHYPLIDLDFPAAVVPSSTPGHSHLYLECELTWAQYEKLLKVMAEIGLIEDGYLAASSLRRATFLRLPWIRKGLERSDRGWTRDEVEKMLEQAPVPADPLEGDAPF